MGITLEVKSEGATSVVNTKSKGAIPAAFWASANSM